MHEPQEDRLLSHAQVQKRVGLARTWLREAVAAGRFPQPTRVGRRLYWSEREVAAWITERLRERTAA